MAEKYTKEQLWKIFEKLPEELKDAIFAEKTADDIYNVCQKNGIEEKKIPEVARLTGNVLLGILPPEKFRESLKKDLNLKKDVTENVGFQIERVIFFPVKKELDEIYRIKTQPETVETTVVEKQPQASKKDVYRESLE